MDFEPIWTAMERVFGDDEKRKEHARQVTRYAEELLKTEPGSEAVVITAAILHDIGIPTSIQKYGSTAGPHQEKEGPPIAHRILKDLGCPDKVTEEVCTIIASHHSPGEVDTDNFRVVYDADWLVNLKDEYDVKDPDKLARIIERIFLTRSGKRMARAKFLGLTGSG